MNEEEKIWTWCEVCMDREDHVLHEGKYHCEKCGAYNPDILVDFDHFYTIILSSKLKGDEDYWRKKYNSLKDKSLKGIRKELPSLAVRAIGSFSRKEKT